MKKVYSWFKSHMNTVINGSVAIIGITGTVIAYKIGSANGYEHGLSDYYDVHCETAKNLIKSCSESGIKNTLLLLRNDPELVEKLHGGFSSVLEKAVEEYNGSQMIVDLIDHYSQPFDFLDAMKQIK